MAKKVMKKICFDDCGGVEHPCSNYGASQQTTLCFSLSLSINPLLSLLFHIPIQLSPSLHIINDAISRSRGNYRSKRRNTPKENKNPGPINTQEEKENINSKLEEAKKSM